MTHNNQQKDSLFNEELHSSVDSIEYIRPEKEDSTLTICVVHAKNGMHFVGQSSCFKIEAFDEDMGQKFAYNDAMLDFTRYEEYHNKSVGMK